MNQDADQKYAGLDALRGILALVVCVAHAWQVFVFPTEPIISTTAHVVLGVAARLAVLWFFCLSGFVIALSTKRNRARFGRFSLTDYALARGFRVLPPLLFAILLAFALRQVLQAAGMAGPLGLPRAARAVYAPDLGQQLLCLATFCARGDLTGGTNGPLWSLAFEIQLYVLAGFGSAAVSLHGHRAWQAAAWLAGIAFAAFSFSRGLGVAYTNVQAVCYLAFACGWLASVIAISQRNALLLAGVTACIMGIIGIVVGPEATVLNLDTGALVIFAQVVFVVAAASVLKVTGASRSPLRTVGAYSYTLYIVHFPLLLAVFFVIVHFHRSYSTSAAWLLALILVVAVIWVARFLASALEQPRKQRAAFQWLGDLAAKSRAQS